MVSVGDLKGILKNYVGIASCRTSPVVTVSRRDDLKVNSEYGHGCVKNFPAAMEVYGNP
jgi:hypothetical protein